MNTIKSYFTIKELENISDISAHNIRMWERRYDLLQPSRTSSNIRYYDLNDLQYLLNISLLRIKGIRISKIANYSKEGIFELVNNIISKEFRKEYAMVELKMAMYGYNVELFERLYEKMMENNSFSNVFKQLFLPFLRYVGLFWQTKTITIAHEHFITNLIYQKIQLNIAQLKQVPPFSTNSTFVLYLPEKEMHEIGILYLNYELRAKGYHTIYLGRSVPIEDLESLKSIYPNICWIGNFTIIPEPKALEFYFKKIKNLLVDTNHEFWAVGQNITSLCTFDLPDQVNIYDSLEEVLNKI